MSPDGRHWEPAELDLGAAGGSPPGAFVSDLAGTEGRLIAGGWIERSPGRRDAAVWHSEDGGRRWILTGSPVPANPEKPDEITTVSRVEGGWLATGYDELDRRGGPSLFTVERVSRMWHSADGLAWERLEPPKGSSDVHLLAGARDVRYVSGGAPGGVSVWRAGPDGAWSDTGDGFQALPNSMSVLEGDGDGLVLAGIEPQSDQRNHAVLWGSVDGFKYRRTLTAPDSAWFWAAVRHDDRWYVYGSSTSGTRGWVASVDCATGQTCADLRP